MPADPTQSTVTAALVRLQHVNGWLADADLRDLAARLEVPLARLEEVVSFFPHFRRQQPSAVEVDVCRDMTCHLRGSAELAKRLRSEPDVHVREVSCLGRCDRAPAVCLNRHAAEPIHDAFYLGRSTDDVISATRAAAAGRAVPPDRDGDLPHTCPDWKIDVYHGNCTFEAAKTVQRQLRDGDDPRTAQAGLDVIAKLRLAGLRGMGGAGAPAWEKWRDVAAAAGDVKYIVCNADESEPGTFKDREILLRAPHLVVEGIAIAMLTCGAARGYVYIRHEYPEEADAVRRAIAAAEKAGICGPEFPITVFVSPGGYICGEQSALIEAMEGKRAQPRNRPPELATNGLFDKPTLVNNVETFAWVPGIVRGTLLSADDPADQFNWYGQLGPAGKGARLFSISGDVARPGVYEMPIGAPLRELIAKAGGVLGGDDALQAVATSGPSGGFVPRWLKDPRDPAKRTNLLESPLDIDAFRTLRLALGAGLVVYAAGADLTAAAVNATEFFRNESCGKCVPCRIGSQKLVEIGLELLGGAEAKRHSGTVRELERALEQTAICALGPSAAKPLATLLRDFPQA